MVVPVFADESGAGRVRRRSAGAGRASVGELVSARGEAGDLDPGISDREPWGGRRWIEQARCESFFSGD